MSKVGLIIGREIKSKLTNKTFIIMTFLTPLIFIGALGLIFWTSMPEKIEQNLLVLDETGLFQNTLKGNDFISLTFSKEQISEAQDNFQNSEYSGILYIFKGSDGNIIPKARLLYKKNPGLAFKTYIRTELERIYYEYKLKANNIDPNIITNARQGLVIDMEKVDENGEIKNSEGIQLFSFAMGLIMMIFILMYGMMVFRSVMEEKTNRIVEVIVSSVRPFELMIGKIIGVALVGIIQFTVTTLLTGILSMVLSGIFLKDINTMKMKFDDQNAVVHKLGTNAGTHLNNTAEFKDNQKMFETINQLQKINFWEVGLYFFLFFIGGYLFYSSLLAAIGSAVDSESDSQQFMLPVMLPLMIGYFLAIKIMISPESNAVIIGSFIPFTSPIVMMARIPQGVPAWQVLSSLAILYVSFICTTWLAGKIYRTGILMYGKKTSWREIGKWLFYK
ncbi:MAG: transporter permease [Bacteroidetes bacterium]|nr:transporter permease [Bacteroidota bacterium]